MERRHPVVLPLAGESLAGLPAQAFRPLRQHVSAGGVEGAGFGIVHIAALLERRHPAFSYPSEDALVSKRSLTVWGRVPKALLERVEVDFRYVEAANRINPTLFALFQLCFLPLSFESNAFLI